MSDAKPRCLASEVGITLETSFILQLLANTEWSFRIQWSSNSPFCPQREETETRAERRQVLVSYASYASLSCHWTRILFPDPETLTSGFYAFVSIVTLSWYLCKLEFLPSHPSITTVSTATLDFQWHGLSVQTLIFAPIVQFWFGFSKYNVGIYP